MAIIDDIIADARQFAQDAVDDAERALNTAATVASGRASAIFPDSLDQVVDVPTAPNFGNEPNFFDYSITDLVPPDSPDLLDPIPVDAFDVDLDVNFPDTPNLQDLGPLPNIDLDAPNAPNISLDLDFPELEGLLDIAPPDLLSVTDDDIPEEPEIDLPTFDGIKPELNAEVPTNLDQKFRAKYEEIPQELRVQLDGYVDDFLLKLFPDYEQNYAKLTKRLCEVMDGKSTILPDSFEQSLFDRNRRRNDGERKNVDAQIRETAARRGFCLPSGVIDAQLVASHQNASNNNANSALEIAIDRLNREQQHLEFVMNQISTQHQLAVNSMLQYLNHLMDVNNFSLQAAERCIQFLVDQFRLELEAYRARLECYRAEADVVNILTRVSLAKIDIYKSLIDALRIKSDVNRDKIALYQAQLSAEEQKVRTFTARINAIDTEARARLLPLEQFRAEIDAFQASTQARRTQIDAARAAIDGNNALVAQYSAQINAERLKIDAARAKIQGLVSQNEVTRDYNQILRQQYETEIQTLTEQLRIEQFRGEERRQNFQLTLRAYLAKLDAESRAYQSELASTVADNGQIIDQNKLRADFALENARQANQAISDNARIALGAGEAFGDQAAAALSSQNTLASINEQTFS